MFITNFKRMLHSLPTENAGHAAFMAHIADKEAVVKPTAEFLLKMTNYALEKIQAPIPVKDPNPRLLMAAFAIMRFPVETLRTPEGPIQFSLLNKTTNLLEIIDRILHEHSPEEDDTMPDLIPADVTALFLTALVEYHAAWTEFSNQETTTVRARTETAVSRLLLHNNIITDMDPAMIFGE
jgi:hypothetical protein